MSSCLICDREIERTISAEMGILCADCVRPVYQEMARSYPENSVEYMRNAGWTFWINDDFGITAKRLRRQRLGLCPQCGGKH